MKLIPLTRGLSSIVDEADFDSLSACKWYASAPSGKNIYAVRWVRGEDAKRLLLMHRTILAPPSGFVVDHINGDGLDNRRSNLRVATVAQNTVNSLKRPSASTYRGVRPVGKNRWAAKIQVAGRFIYLGCFKDVGDAARAYDSAAASYFGEFARLNFPTNTPISL